MYRFSDSVDTKTAGNYLIAQCSSPLSPVNMIQNQQKSTTQSSSLAEKLLQFNHMLPSIADSSKEQFEKFLLSLDEPTKDNYMQFYFSKSRVDKFLGAHFKDKTALWVICKLIFTLSHRQCAVEWGFSINREVLIENLQEKSIVCQIIVYDHVQASKVDLHNYPVSSVLLKSCKSARLRYSTHLEEQRSKVKGD